VSSPTSDPTSSSALQRFRPSTLDDDRSPALAAMDHGAVVEAPHGAELVSYNPDAPSEEWGWHGHWSDFAPRGRRMFLWVGVFGLLLLTWGNHVSHVEDYFLVFSALALAGWIIVTERANKRKRRIRP
jgi:hypothetical protein